MNFEAKVEKFHTHHVLESDKNRLKDLSKESMLIFEQGNTELKMVLVRPRKSAKITIPTQVLRTNEDIHKIIISTIKKSTRHDISKIKKIAISSVAKDVTEKLISSVKEGFNSEPLVVSTQLPNLGINYGDYHKLGEDRVCNTVGAYNRYGGPVIAVDAGSATTIECVCQNGNFLGGMILPGYKDFKLQIPGLYNDNQLEKPKEVLAKNTQDNLDVGRNVGYSLMIFSAIEEMKQQVIELGEKEPTVIGTGGLISPISDMLEHLRTTTVNMKTDEYLTIKGVYDIFNLHR